jgi:hypothetical protein
MTNLPATIETMERSYMRAWINRDIKALKTLTARNFRMVIAARPSVILDHKSWVDAAATRYLCSSYRFGDIYVRDLGALTIFATRLEIEATMDGHDWSGEYWISDLWRKSKLRRNWRLVERVVSRPEQNPDAAAAIQSLQLWRRS